MTALEASPVALFGIGAVLAADLALGLADAGAPVAVLCAEGELSVAEDVQDKLIRAGAMLALAGFDPESAESVRAAFARVADNLGPLRAVVDISTPGPGPVRLPLGATDPEAWTTRVGTPLRHSLHRLQGSYRWLREGGGRIVVIVPTLSMTGASGLVAWTTVTEGQRALVKVAARAWGAEGISVNCLAVPADLLAGNDASSGVALDRPGLPTPSFGSQPAARGEVASAVAALLGSKLPLWTGATLAVDGGVWMTP